MEAKISSQYVLILFRRWRSRGSINFPPFSLHDFPKIGVILMAHWQFQGAYSHHVDVLFQSIFQITIKPAISQTRAGCVYQDIHIAIRLCLTPSIGAKNVYRLQFVLLCYGPNTPRNFIQGIDHVHPPPNVFSLILYSFFDRISSKKQYNAEETDSPCEIKEKAAGCQEKEDKVE
jgi:hypothetical protein